MEARDYIAALNSWGLTQEQIAERCETTQATISKVLRGDVKDVLSRNYRKLQALYEEVRADRKRRRLPVDGEAVKAA